jgi:hypothetical protein
MDHGEIELGGEDWIGMVQDADKWRPLVNAVMNLQVVYKSQKTLPWQPRLEASN